MDVTLLTALRYSSETTFSYIKLAIIYAVTAYQSNTVLRQSSPESSLQFFLLYYHILNYSARQENIQMQKGSRKFSHPLTSQLE